MSATKRKNSGISVTSNFDAIPLDTLYIVCDHLCSADIRCWSKSNTQFREVLHPVIINRWFQNRDKDDDADQVFNTKKDGYQFDDGETIKRAIIHNTSCLSWKSIWDNLTHLIIRDYHVGVRPEDIAMPKLTHLCVHTAKSPPPINARRLPNRLIYLKFGGHYDYSSGRVSGIPQFGQLKKMVIPCYPTQIVSDRSLSPNQSITHLSFVVDGRRIFDYADMPRTIQCLELRGERSHDIPLSFKCPLTVTSMIFRTRAPMLKMLPPQLTHLYLPRYWCTDEVQSLPVLITHFGIWFKNLDQITCLPRALTHLSVFLTKTEFHYYVCPEMISLVSRTLLRKFVTDLPAVYITLIAPGRNFACVRPSLEITQLHIDCINILQIANSHIWRLVTADHDKAWYNWPIICSEDDDGYLDIDYDDFEPSGDDIGDEGESEVDIEPSNEIP